MPLMIRIVTTKGMEFIINILKMLVFEVKQYIKSFAIIILIIAPYFMMIVASGYAEISEEKSYKFAVLEDIDDSAMDKLSRCGNVALYNSKEDIENAIGSDNEIIGLFENTIIISDNTNKYVENYAKLILKSKGQNTEITVEDLGVKSTIYKYGIVSFLINASVLISGLIFGLSLLRERLNGTYKELKPYGIKDEYFYAIKLITPSALLFINVWAILNEFKLQDINTFLVYIFTATSILLILTIGTTLYSIPKNQNKSFITFVAIIVVFIISTALIVYTNFDFLIFILPFYWSFFTIYNILGDSISLWNFLTYCIAFLAMNIAYIKAIRNFPLSKNKHYYF